MADLPGRFDYIEVTAFGVLLILTLIDSYWLLRRASPATAVRIPLGGIVIALHIGCNDVLFMLVMLGQIAIVFGGASVLSQIAAKARGIKSWI